jgi:pimeloyl-ACP methyl ester carboxylesterase
MSRRRAILHMVTFTPFHRGGSGPPLVCLHGFTDNWRTWELVLPALERRHDVLAPALPGHAGGPPVDVVTDGLLVGHVERLMDEAGWETAHVAGNSLGAYVALQLAARGRARSVVALAPGGGWARGDDDYREVLAKQLTMGEQVKLVAHRADAIAATPEGRRRAGEWLSSHPEDLPPDLVADLIRGAAACTGLREMTEYALEHGWTVEPERIACPVRVVWGTEDRLLEWPRAAARYRTEWLPHADWVVLDGVGHAPQLDVPLETAELILGFTGA